MFYIPSSPKKYKKYWGKIRKKAPKVPDLTCPAIDDILDKLEKSIGGKPLTLAKYKMYERQMEKLRKANEALRDSGKYWHDECKEVVRDFFGKRINIFKS